MPRSRPTMQEVLLEDVDVPPAGTPVPAGPGTDGDGDGDAGVSDGPQPGRPGRARRAWVFGAVALIGVAAAVARPAAGEPAPGALAGVRGALTAVDGPVAELWRTDLRVTSALRDVSGLLVGAVEAPDRSEQLVALHPGTGETAWSTPLRGPGGPRRNGAECALPDVRSGHDPVAACVVTDAEEAVDLRSSPGDDGGASARLVLVRTTDGRVLRDEPTDPSATVAALGPDVVTSRVGADGRVTVDRSDPVTGEIRWTFTGAEPLRATAYGREAWIGVFGDLVLVGGDTGWVLSADGGLVHQWDAGPWGPAWFDIVGDGLLLEAAAGDATEVVDLHAGRTYGVDGRPVGTVLDDGSVPGLVLVQAPGDLLAGYTDRGDRRWTAPDAGIGASGLLILDGRVIRTHEGALSALDARTGETVWTTPLAPATELALTTDGRVVLCGRRDPDRGVVLGAYGVDDGRLRWDVVLPDGVDHVAVAAGRLFGLTDDEIVALG